MNKHSTMGAGVLGLGLAISAVAMPGALHAAPLQDGPYLAPMASYVLTDDSAYDDGLGGTLAGGYRMGWWAVEASAVFSRFGASGDGDDADVYGGSLNALLFPLSGLPNLFALVGVGGLSVEEHPVIERKYSLTTLEGGAGYLLPLSWGRYEFAIRGDARYRAARRERRVDPDGDLDIPRRFDDVLLNVGLQLPLGLREPELPQPEPAPEPVQVVEAADSDGDGVSDDLDQCPDTPSGVSVDDTGCALPPPCDTSPELGAHIALSGCGQGDVIVLRGVHFGVDEARVTTTGQRVLDRVAEELQAHPGIHVEIGGHTDDTGHADYNRKLSEQRAEAVVNYLDYAGVSSERMTSVGYGQDQPAADNATEEGRAQNRRVALRITQTAQGAAPPPPEETVPQDDLPDYDEDLDSSFEDSFDDGFEDDAEDDFGDDFEDGYDDDFGDDFEEDLEESYEDSGDTESGSWDDEDDDRDFIDDLL